MKKYTLLMNRKNQFLKMSIYQFNPFIECNEISITISQNFYLLLVFVKYKKLKANFIWEIRHFEEGKRISLYQESLLSYSNGGSSVSEQEKIEKSVEKNRKHRNKPLSIWQPDRVLVFCCCIKNCHRLHDFNNTNLCILHLNSLEVQHGLTEPI